jgi:hypothetical protein
LSGCTVGSFSRRAQLHELVINEKGSILKLSIYLQRKFASKTHLAEALTFAQYQTSKVEMSLNVGVK